MSATHKANDAASSVEKQEVGHVEQWQEIHKVDSLAQDGHAATDRYGHALYIVDEKAEAALRWKMDIRIMPVIALLYLFCFIDRANIGNARLAGLEVDLGLVGYDYNLLLTSFYVAYVAFELPCNFICKLWGPGKFIPTLSFAFGLFSFVMAFVHSFGAAFAVRFMLGIAEAGVFPGMGFYLTRWYRKDELGFRLALFIVSAPLAGAFGGLLASGFLKCSGFGMVRTWRIIFFAEGLITMGLAIISWFILADRPETAPWLTPEEKALAAARIKSENVGSTVVLDTIHKKVVKQAIFNPTTITVGFIFLLDNITVQGLGFFLPTIIRSIYPGRTTIELQLRTVPPYIVGSFFTLLAGYMSWKTGRRALYMVLSAPLMVCGFAMFVGSRDPQVRYAATFLIASGAFSFGGLCNTWAAVNTTSDTARAASLGTVVFMGNCGGLISTWSYLTKFAPNQIPGNSLNLGTSSTILLLSGAMWLWQIKENKAKDQGRDDHYLEGKSDDDIAMLGIHHPGFRYRH